MKKTINRVAWAAAAALLASAAWGQAAGSKLKRVLLYSGNQWRHHSIPDVETFVKNLATEKGFQVDVSPATAFTPTNLANYQVVVLNNNVGLGGTLNTSQRDALAKWFEAGGGLMGFHANMDHRNQWDWYNDVSGTVFSGHSNIEAATLHFPPEAQTNPVAAWIMEGWGGPMTVGGKAYNRAAQGYDEWYNYRNTMVNVAGTTVLLKTIHASYKCLCSMDAENHQAAWIRVYKGGRQFNSTMGGESERNNASFVKAPSKEMLYRAMQWTAGDVPTTLAPRGEGRAARLQGTLGKSMAPGAVWDLTGRVRLERSAAVLAVDAQGSLRLIP